MHNEAANNVVSQIVGKLYFARGVQCNVASLYMLARYPTP